MGFFAGVGTGVSLGEVLSIQPWVVYVQKGAEFSGGGEDTYSYIEIPVFVSLGFPLSESVGLGISAGPQVAFNLTCNESVPGEADFDCKDYDDYDGSTEFGFVASASLLFPVGSSSLSVGGGVDFGLTDIFTELDGGYKNRVFYLFAGYGLSLGGM